MQSRRFFLTKKLAAADRDLLKRKGMVFMHILRYLLFILTLSFAWEEEPP